MKNVLLIICLTGITGCVTQYEKRYACVQNFLIETCDNKGKIWCQVHNGSIYHRCWSDEEVKGFVK